MSLWSRLANVFRSGGVEQELDEELQFHVNERIRELMGKGLTREAATADAMRRLGGRLRMREESRDVKLLPWLDSLVRDVRLGARMLRKHAVVSGAAIASLSLAIGACVAAFSLVDALILRPLPVRQPERLVQLSIPESAPDRPPKDDFSDPVFQRLRDAGRGRVDLFAISYPERPSVTFPSASGAVGERERARLQFVSGDTFEQLGVVPAAGRLLTSRDDEQPGAHPVAVVSHAFWMQRFGGDPAIIGRWFTLHARQQDRQLQIVGVAEPRFGGIEPGRPTDVWLPWTMGDPHAFGNFEYRSLRIIGRLGDDVSLEQAHGVLQAAFTTLQREYVARNVTDPMRFKQPDRVARFINTPLFVTSAATGPSRLRHQFERPLWILAAIAALVLLIAGSNVANLFLARTAARAREMSLRLSLGAGRGRLIQQVLVESALVGVAACIIGLTFAAVAAPMIVDMLTSIDDPVSLDLRVDWRLVAFISTLTLLITMLFGLAPALRASSTAPMTALKSSDAGRASARVGAIRPFVALQVAFSLAVLFVGGLLVVSFVKLTGVNPGFATSDVLLMSWETTQRVEPPEQRAALVRILDRLRDVPGVQAAGAMESSLLGRWWRQTVRVPGTENTTVEATVLPVTPGFLETMTIPLLAGRTFARGEIEALRPAIVAVVVNEAFAKAYFGREPAVGRIIGTHFDKARTPVEVVGVVADARHDLRQPPAPTIYTMWALGNFNTLHVRVAGDRTALAPRLRDEVRAAAPLFRVTSIASQASAVARTLLRERLLALLSGFFAVVGLVLTAVGLYGVLTHAVVQRTREIGIRMALGARALGAVRTVITDAATTTAIGAACGLVGGWYLSRFVESLLFEVTPGDASSFALPLVTILVAALIAAALPAWRAARVDPVIALRTE